MKSVASTLIFGPALAFGTASHASSPVTVDGAIEKFCEPLVAGASADQITSYAHADGFKSSEVDGQPILVYREIVLGISDNPRVCLVQAAPDMTFAQGISLVDQWAARYADATLGDATEGPDGSRVRVWTVARENKYLLVSEQPSPNGGKVLNFILAPLPGS